MGAQIFNKLLTGSFVPSSPFMISGDSITIDFAIVITGGAATIEWFLEFCEGNPNDSATTWFQETAEEDSAGGVVLMPKVVRTFADNAGTTLAIGTHDVSAQFKRKHQFARFSMKEATGGAVVATVVATIPFGTVSPPAP